MPEASARRRHEIPIGWILAIVLDVAAPVALYYALRGAGIGTVGALVISGLPPGIRVLVSYARTRQLDALGVLVLLALAVTILASVLGGSARTLLVRNALASLPFAAWMIWSARMHRPLTYELAESLLPSRAASFEAVWAGPAFPPRLASARARLGRRHRPVRRDHLRHGLHAAGRQRPGTGIRPRDRALPDPPDHQQLSLHRAGAMRAIFSHPPHPDRSPARNASALH